MSQKEKVYRHLQIYGKIYDSFKGIGYKLRSQVAQEQGLTSLKSLRDREGLDDESLLSQIPAIAKRQLESQKDVIEALKLTYSYYTEELEYDITRPLLTALHIKAFSIAPQLRDTYRLYQEQSWEEFVILFDTSYGQGQVLDITGIPPVKSEDDIEHGFLELLGHLPVHIGDQLAKDAAVTYSKYIPLLQKDNTGATAIQANIEDITMLASESRILIPELVRRGARFGYALYRIMYPLTVDIAPEWGTKPQ